MISCLHKEEIRRNLNFRPLYRNIFTRIQRILVLLSVVCPVHWLPKYSWLQIREVLIGP